MDGSEGGADGFAALADAHLVITGGTLTVDAEGDGLDFNRSRTVPVDGPTSSGDGALDVNGTFEVTAAFHPAGMAVARTRFRPRAWVAVTPDPTRSMPLVRT